MKKKLVAVCLMVVLLVMACMEAGAAEPRAAEVIPSLSFEGTTANCQVKVSGVGKVIVATLELWNGNTLVDSWSGTATTLLIINGSCAVTKGVTYTLKVSGTIGGVEFEGTPVSSKCN